MTILVISFSACLVYPLSLAPLHIDLKNRPTKHVAKYLKENTLLVSVQLYTTGAMQIITLNYNPQEYCENRRCIHILFKHLFAELLFTFT